MAEMGKRVYHSPQRTADALDTRRRIRDAATDLFVRQGYARTTLKQIAEAAGVGERTLYDAFRSKVHLLRHTVGVATLGSEDRVSFLEHPAWVAARNAPTAAAALSRHTRLTADLMERAGDLIMVALEVAGSDDEVARSVRAGIASSHDVHLALTDVLHRKHWLRAGLDPTGAADVLYGLCSPHLHHLLRRDRGWSAARYRSWLRGSAAQQVLGTPPRAAGRDTAT